MGEWGKNSSSSLNPGLKPKKRQGNRMGELVVSRRKEQEGGWTGLSRVREEGCPQ